MAETIYFWIKEDSTFTFKGKDFVYGDALPKGVAPEVIKSLSAKKCIAANMPVGVTTPGEADGLRVQLDAANSQVKALGEQLDAANSQVNLLTEQLAEVRANSVEAEGQHTKLAEDLAAANGRIAELETELALKGGKK